MQLAKNPDTFLKADTYEQFSLGKSKYFLMTSHGRVFHNELRTDKIYASNLANFTCFCIFSAAFLYNKMRPFSFSVRNLSKEHMVTIRSRGTVLFSCCTVWVGSLVRLPDLVCRIPKANVTVCIEKLRYC